MKEKPKNKLLPSFPRKLGRSGHVLDALVGWPLLFVVILIVLSYCSPK